MSSRKVEYLGEPTLGQVMRRPQWILALLLAMIVAAAFAWLGQWQLDNAIRSNVDEISDTETVRPLDDLTAPIAGIPEVAAGAVASLDGDFVPGDYLLVEQRMNGGGSDGTGKRTEGVWIVGHFQRTGEHPASLAVAVGWAPSAEAARTAITKLDKLEPQTRTIEGRYLPAEAPDVPKRTDDPHVMRTMLPAYVANEWAEVPTGPVYGGYLVMHPAADAPDIAAAGLDPVDSVAPSAPERVSWLNVFYAIEWVVFAVVALFLWYRLARDAWEKEHEMLLLIAASEAAEADQDPALAESDTSDKS